MSLFCRSLLRYHPRTLHSALSPFSNGTFFRSLSTDEYIKRPRKSGAQEPQEKEADPEHLFRSDNLKELSKTEIARLRVVYGLVKEHIEASKQKLDSVDTERNPLLDPRSFEINKLPTLPPSLLKHFRKELPGDVAAVSRPVLTHGIWDSSKDKVGDGETEATLENAHAAEWAAVDERTMESRQYARMQRQSFGKHMDVPFKMEAMDYVRKKKKKKKNCPLSDARGRVDVDFRAVATLTSFMTENGKILSKRKSGLSSKAQRKLSKAVKTARQMALIHPEPDPMPTYEELLEIEKSLP